MMETEKKHCPYCGGPMRLAGHGDSGQNRPQAYWCNKCRRRTMRTLEKEREGAGTNK